MSRTSAFYSTVSINRIPGVQAALDLDATAFEHARRTSWRAWAEEATLLSDGVLGSVSASSASTTHASTT